MACCVQSKPCRFCRGGNSESSQLTGSWPRTRYLNWAHCGKMGFKQGRGLRVPGLGGSVHNNTASAPWEWSRIHSTRFCQPWPIYDPRLHCWGLPVPAGDVAGWGTSSWKLPFVYPFASPYNQDYRVLGSASRAPLFYGNPCAGRCADSRCGDMQCIAKGSVSNP